MANLNSLLQEKEQGFQGDDLLSLFPELNYREYKYQGKTYRRYTGSGISYRKKMELKYKIKEVIKNVRKETI